MPDPIPRGPFDQGLFLTHFNKGRDLYEAQQFEEAERELEEAYLLRPRDQRVLNLLGLVYFRQDKLEKAEEVYRKLAAESPEAHTLHYNLGLIYFKLNRLEDAESSFLKALELSKGNPKINFYLGSIYERLHRHKDAIYQYRQAGANLMVRRVEDKMAAAEPGKSARTGRKKDDTAEFPKRELQESIRRHADEALARADQAMVMGKVLQPVSPAIMADGAPAVGAPEAPSDVTEDTARFRLRKQDTEPPDRLRKQDTEPPEGAGAAPPPAPAKTDPMIRRSPAEVFRFLENNLMEVDFSGKIFLKQGTIYSYSGNLTFWVKEKRSAGLPALVIVTGSGRIILTDRDREITFMHVMDEAVYVEPGHLLACEEGLSPRYVSIGGDQRQIEFLALEGRGMVALSAASKPLPMAVTPGLPVSVPASSVVLWSGDVRPRLVEDPQLYEIMLPAGGPAGSLIRLEGAGRVLVEQAAS
ncbi:MAG TPA: tetratricopeptide repeat protein [Vicinamibacteria bacterium]|nr:tetratricopeptide repeat protein [Vicinamibacteria bacterium]